VKKFIFSIISFVTFTGYVFSQITEENKYVKTWKVANKFGAVDTIPVDTAHRNFQQTHAVERFSIANAFNGNLGSPLQSKIYFDRPAAQEFIFGEAYVPYIKTIDNNVFYNTKTPFSSLRYLTGGTNYREEDQIGFLFTANANKKLNFGTTLDYIYARGEYQNQAAKRFEGSLFGSYDGRRYSAKGVIAYNSLNHFENGGIQDPLYILNPPFGYTTATIPVNLGEGVQNTFKQFQFFYNHSYSLGFERDVKQKNDSVIKEFVPVTRFTHTIQLDDNQRRYLENSVESDFYRNTYYVQDETRDTVRFQRVSNMFAVSLAEEFNKWMQFGLSAYAENEVEKYYLMEDDSLQNRLRSNTKIGGILSKERGQAFTYKVNAEITLLGPKIGDFLLDADFAGNFKLWKDTISLRAKGFMRLDEPSYLFQHYESNHFKWENNFVKTLRTHVGGTFAVPTRNFSLDVAVENVTGKLYFDSLALPRQFEGNVQIVSANLKQDFYFGKFALENNVVYQLSSNQSVLPLPALALYHNFYFHDKWFNVLSAQFGVDVRYHTAYYAPAYMPATGQFHAQDKMKIGNYPEMSVYANLHLKRTRFFIKYYHVNELFMNGLYYSIPGYPINPALLKLGLTWNFYD
jgi:hypothetical protein